MYDASEKNLLMALGKVVKKRRLELLISQEQLAELANLHRTYVADVERGSRNLGFINLARLAEALDMSLSDLVGDIPRASGGKSVKVKVAKLLNSRRKA